MSEIDCLDCDTDWIDLDVLEHEATPNRRMILGIYLHVTGVVTVGYRLRSG
jgi:hypothetical protein